MKFEVYGRVGCQNCMTAKTMLHRTSKKNESISYEYLEYDEHKDKLVEQFGEQKSLPVIVLNGNEQVQFHNLESKLKG